MRPNSDLVDERHDIFGFAEEGGAEDLLAELNRVVSNRASGNTTSYSIDPTSASAKRALVEHLLEYQRHDEALEESLRFVALATMEPQHHVLLAMVHEARGDTARTRAVIPLTLAADTDEP